MRRPGDRDRRTVTCAACGGKVVRAASREYDKYGDRWNRANKEFEHLCKDCHRTMSHHPRRGLEALLVDIGAGTVDNDTFVRRYEETIRSRSEASEEP